MGRIRSKYLKRMARKLLEVDGFTTDFEKNKKRIVEIADVPSKKMRNRVIGYIIHLLKKEV